MYVLEIKKDLIPYTFKIVLANELYEMRIDYNNKVDMFTVSLLKDGVELCVGEPIVYGLPLFSEVNTRKGFPQIYITPIDESGENNAVTFDNLSSTVMLRVTGGEYGE